jgi:hypothetical protein
MDIRKQGEDEERDIKQTTQSMKKLNINIGVHAPLRSYALHDCVVSIRPTKMGGRQ